MACPITQGSHNYRHKNHFIHGNQLLLKCSLTQCSVNTSSQYNKHTHNFC